MPKKRRKLDPKTNDTTRNLLDLAGDIDEEELEEAAEQEDPQDETDELSPPVRTRQGDS
jgi:hypothetical protein